MTLNDMLVRLQEIKGCKVLIQRSEYSYTYDGKAPRFSMTIGLNHNGLEINTTEQQREDEEPETAFGRAYDRFMKSAEATDLFQFLAPPIEVKQLTADVSVDF